MEKGKIRNDILKEHTRSTKKREPDIEEEFEHIFGRWKPKTSKIWKPSWDRDLRSVIRRCPDTRFIWEYLTLLSFPKQHNVTKHFSKLSGLKKSLLIVPIGEFLYGDGGEIHKRTFQRYLRMFCLSNVLLPLPRVKGIQFYAIGYWVKDFYRYWFIQDKEVRNRLNQQRLETPHPYSAEEENSQLTEFAKRMGLI